MRPTQTQFRSHIFFADRVKGVHEETGRPAVLVDGGKVWAIRSEELRLARAPAAPLVTAPAPVPAAATAVATALAPVCPPTTSTNPLQWLSAPLPKVVDDDEKGQQVCNGSCGRPGCQHTVVCKGGNNRNKSMKK